MVRRRVVALCTLLVGVSLVGAPVTMADWGEQASHSVEPVDPDEVHDEMPVYRSENLSAAGQRAVRRAVESPDGRSVEYGREDWPEEFQYSDDVGYYVVVYEGQHYQLTTYASGGFPFLYWVFELPFVAYGLVLGWLGVGVTRETRSEAVALALTGVGVGFHRLGPAFDFPILDPGPFVLLGLLAAVLVPLGFVVQAVRDRSGEPIE